MDELIPEQHLVRVINQLIDRMKLEAIENAYKGGETSSYHPRMLLKLIVYAYAEKNNSGRQTKIETNANLYSFVLKKSTHNRRKALEQKVSELGLIGRSKKVLKQNGRFRRFHLRGLEKVEVEWGILSMAHNRRKLVVE